MSLNPEQKREIIPSLAFQPLNDSQLMTLVGIGWENLGHLFKTAQVRHDSWALSVEANYYYFASILERRGESAPVSAKPHRFVHRYNEKDYVFIEPPDIAPLYEGMGYSVLEAREEKEKWIELVGEADPMVKDLSDVEGRLETMRKMFYLYSEPPHYRRQGPQREARTDFELRNQAGITRNISRIPNNPIELINRNTREARRRIENMRRLKLPSTF